MSTLQEVYEEEKFNTEISINQIQIGTVFYSIFIDENIKLYKKTGNDEFLNTAQQLVTDLHQKVIPYIGELDIALEELKKSVDKYSPQESEFIFNLVKDHIAEVKSSANKKNSKKEE